METSEVAEWYKGQSILLTGGTGFMGTVFVEKLLRCCPDLPALYLIIRHKRGKDPKQRLEEYLESKVFAELRESGKSDVAFKKLRVIEGDLCEDGCGLSQENVELLQEEATVVLHAAADVRFDQPIREAVIRNVAGTRNLLDLACTFKRLKIFMHVSTAYCQCQEQVLEETVYESMYNPRSIIEMVNTLDEDILKTISSRLMGHFPNSYAFTKHLTEGLIQEYSDKLHIAITRPSIVTSVYREPFPGWSSNMNGPIGLLVGAGTGILRVMHVQPDFPADFVPVDMVNNEILLIIWNEGKREKKKGLEVYNITATEKSSITSGKFLDQCRQYLPVYPATTMVWYPDGNLEPNAVLFEIKAFLKHTIPANVIDLLIPLITGHPAFMKKLQRRIRTGLDVLSYYTTRRWVFKHVKFGDIYRSMNKTDKLIFYTNWEEFDWDYYIDRLASQLRTHINNDTPDTIPQAQRKLKRLYYLHITVQLIFWVLVFLAFYHYVVLSLVQ